MVTAVADAKVVRWGNSQGVRIPRAVCDATGIDVGDAVRVVAAGSTIVISATSHRPRYLRSGHRSLEEIFAGYDGPPMGEEWAHGRVGAEVLDD